MNKIAAKDIDYLLSPKAIRETTQKIYNMAKSGQTSFKVVEQKLESCADFLMEVIKDNYPDLDIPFHSRWGHFKIGGIDREQELDKLISSQDAIEQARVKLDLVITSVLLDAGAGKDWKYTEGEKTFNRSEGLAVASYHMFKNGIFSQDQSFKAQAESLMAFSDSDLELGFQVSETNPLVGVSGRTKLIKRLGEVVKANRTIFPGSRPGNILDYLINTHGKSFEVQDILQAVLHGLGPIWPGRIDVDGISLGDVWHYPPFGPDITRDSVVCFHKLSQWLTYSMVTPMMDAGLKVTGAEKLTGLAEYRNGGLFLDFGVLELRDEKHFEKAHKPNSEIIIEWRGLTIQLLDKVGALVQQKLGKTPADFPLAKVLEGGTWWAGRRLAQEKRQGGEPPLRLDSDGTVF